MPFRVAIRALSNDAPTGNNGEGEKTMTIHRLALAASAAVLAGLLTVGTASAMPVGSVKAAAENLGTNVDNVAWICGPRGCWWRPGYYWRRWSPYRRWW